MAQSQGLADARHPKVVNKNKMIGVRGSFLSVSSRKDGRRGTTIHDATSRGFEAS